MNIGGATEYRNTSQLFIGVNLLKIVVGDVSGVLGEGIPLTSGGGENFSILSFEMLNFCAFWTVEREIVQQWWLYNLSYDQSYDNELVWTGSEAVIGCFSEEQDRVSQASDDSDSGNCSHVESPAGIPATVRWLPMFCHSVATFSKLS